MKTKKTTLEKLRTYFSLLVYTAGAIALIITFWLVVCQTIAVMAFIFLGYVVYVFEFKTKSKKPKESKILTSPEQFKTGRIYESTVTNYKGMFVKTNYSATAGLFSRIESDIDFGSIEGLDILTINRFKFVEYKG